MMYYLLFYFIFYHCVTPYSSAAKYQSSEELKNDALNHMVTYSGNKNPSKAPIKSESLNSNYKTTPLFINSSPLDFTPTRLYAQVRHRDIVKQLPRERISNETQTDEEQENINRLRAVLKKQKINTYYTEEGFEDAAYDHAGHIRDGNYDEKYDTDVSKKKGSHENQEKNDENNNDDDNFNESVEFKKFDTELPRYGFFKAWEESGDNPKKFTQSEIWKLESDLIEKNRQSAVNAETDIPESLKYLSDNSEDNTSDNDEYNTISRTLEDDDSDENDVSDFMSWEKKSESTFRIVAAPLNSTLKFLKTNTSNAEGNVKHSTSNLKPLPVSIKETINVTTTPKSYYPSLSRVYETWKRNGIEEKYEESSKVRSGEHNTISQPYDSKEYLDKASTEPEITKGLNKKYVLLIRKPTVSSNDLKSKDLYLKKKELTVLQPPLLSPPPQSKRVIYDDFLSKNHDDSIKSSVTHQRHLNGTKIKNNNNNNIPPPPSPPIFVSNYHYHPMHYRHQPTWRDLKNYILPSIEMVPPTRTSRSEYAHYNTGKRNGNNKPQYNFRPEVLKNRLVFRIGSKTPEKEQKYFMDEKKRNYKKVPLRSVNNSYQSVNGKKLFSFRQKRNVKDLLNGVPNVVEQVIDEEINMRFPEDQSMNDNDEKENYSSSSSSSVEEIENVSEDEKKVEVEVPDFNFSEIINPSLLLNNNNTEKIKEIESPLNKNKYPFYGNNGIQGLSPLKYITNPRQIPRKTLGGSEFYDSRDKYRHCEEINPDLSKVVPEKDEAITEHDSNKGLPRLQGLGDQIACYKAKYFDENPLDNPIFYEKKIEPPSIPQELNPFNFFSRISHSSSDPEVVVHRRVSRKPEIIDIRPLESRKNEIIDSNQYEWSQPEKLTSWPNHARKHRSRLETTTKTSPFMPYQKLVYENVMDTIKNLTHLYRQYPSTLKSKVKVSSRLKKIEKPPNFSQNQSKKKIKNNFIYITTQTPDVSSTISSSDEGYHRKFKNFPYRTKKVTYRTRKISRPVRGVSNATIDFIKTVRVHKREADPTDLDIGESKTIVVSNNTLMGRRYKRPKNNTLLDQTTVSAKKIVYTIIDRVKNFDNKKSHGQNDLTTESTSTIKNEPKYTSIRRFDKDIYDNKNTNNSNDLRKIDERYDVYEENQDEQTESSKEIKQVNRDVLNDSSGEKEDDSDSEQFSRFHDDESSGADNSEPETYKNQSEEKVEQVERPNESNADSSDDDDDKSSNSDESNNTENYHKNKSGFFTISDHEKNFDRYSSRPLSSHQNFYDSKYAHLGPRINKPAFYHPNFESINSENDADEEYRDSSVSKEDKGEHNNNNYRVSKFTFPWDDNDKDTSEDMSKYKKIRRSYEFPWERRARLLAMREEIDRRLAKEHFPLESVNTFRRMYPSKSSMKPLFNNFHGNFWKDDIDSHGMNSELYPTEYNHHKKKQLKSSKRIEKPLAKLDGGEQDNLTDTITTTLLQIPPTTAKLLMEENTSTTPIVLQTTPKESYTVRPRNRRPLKNIKNTKALTNDQFNSESKIVTSSTPRVLFRRINRKRNLPNIITPTTATTTTTNNNNRNKKRRSNNNRRLKKNLSSVTIKPFEEKSTNYSIPAKNKTEKRSQVSEEKMITKTTYPLIRQNMEWSKVNSDDDYNENDNSNNNNDDTQIHKMIKKLSIVTNKNPDRIFMTQEIEKNGKKNVFFTTIPNNRTQDSLETN